MTLTLHVLSIILTACHATLTKPCVRLTCLIIAYERDSSLVQEIQASKQPSWINYLNLNNIRLFNRVPRRVRCISTLGCSARPTTRYHRCVYASVPFSQMLHPAHAPVWRIAPMQLGWATERASELRVVFRRKGRTELKTKTCLNSTRIFLLAKIWQTAFSCAALIYIQLILLYTLSLKNADILFCVKDAPERGQWSKR